MSPTGSLPLLYTHVMGSHGFPGWFWTALDKVKAGEYGATDEREMFADATQLAIRDQERAGIDVICDGQMPRTFVRDGGYRLIGPSAPAQAPPPRGPPAPAPRP